MRGWGIGVLAAVLLLPAFGQAPAVEWKKMFDGKSMEGWKETPFIARGKVSLQDGAIVMGSGAMTGVNYTKPFPKYNYEVRMESARLDGYDFFSTVTFPVGDTFCSLVVGGWGGGVVGLSSLDEMDASENDTSNFKEFKRGQWYKIRVRVSGGAIRAWIDDELMVEVGLAGRRVGLKDGTQIDLSTPFGIATYSTTGAVRNIEYREVSEE